MQQDSGATVQARMSCLIALKREKDERRGDRTETNTLRDPVISANNGR